jgi:hypothetical protein
VRTSLFVSLGTLLTAAWLVLLGALALRLIESIL